jgi:hypothetical protein
LAIALADIHSELEQVHGYRLPGADLHRRDNCGPNQILLCVVSTSCFVTCQISNFSRTLIFNVFPARLVDEFKQVANADVKIFAQSIQSFDVHSISSLLIEQGNGVSVKAGITSNVADFELSLAHQTGQVAFDHVVLLVKMSF